LINAKQFAQLIIRNKKFKSYSPIHLRIHYISAYIVTAFIPAFPGAFIVALYRSQQYCASNFSKAANLSKS
jgi:hypothetical protein